MKIFLMNMKISANFDKTTNIIIYKYDSIFHNSQTFNSGNKTVTGCVSTQRQKHDSNVGFENRDFTSLFLKKIRGTR